MRQRRASRGFTLAELMVVSAATGLLMMMFATLLVRIVRFDASATARADAQGSARAAIGLISRQASQAEGDSIIIDRADAGQPPYSRLTFADSHGRTVAFYQQGPRLYQTVLVGGALSRRVLATGLRQAFFSYLSSDDEARIAVSVTFQDQRPAAAGTSMRLGLSVVRVHNAQGG